MSVPKVIYYQGSRGAYSHGACEAICSRHSFEAELIERASFPEVFAALKATAGSFAVIPLENSSIGAIGINYDLLRTQGGRILAETLLPIQHCLLAKSGTNLTRIEKVYSHWAALDQCRSFFKQHPHITPVEFADTAGAASLVSESNDPTIAAIAKAEAATIYQLDVVARAIQDYKDNETRFALISLDNSLSVAQTSFAQETDSTRKCTILFDAVSANFPQTLTLRRSKITSIVSRAIPEKAWHYAVFVDVLCQNADEIDELERVPGARILGVYHPAPTYVHASASENFR